jgi:hypothetical protein
MNLIIISSISTFLFAGRGAYNAAHIFTKEALGVSSFSFDVINGFLSYSVEM